MTRRLLVVFCCVLLTVATTFAQARSGKSRQGGSDFRHVDWNAHAAERARSGVGHDGAEVRRQERRDRDGRRASESRRGQGWVILRSEVRSAQAEAREDERPAVLLVLDGTVVKGTASGKVNGDGGAGEFKITKKP